MKKRTIPFQQQLGHDIEDEDQAQEYLEESLPLVGEVVMFFNSLEQSLASTICEIISDRSDCFGLIVLHNFGYAAKVDLFKRFCDEFHIAFERIPPRYEGLIDSLLELGRLRNLVVHADWANTDHEGYTFVRLKLTVKGMEQEYVQFSPESLAKMIEKIHDTRHQLSDYWQERGDLLSRQRM